MNLDPDDGAVDFEPDQFEDSETFGWDCDGGLTWEPLGGNGEAEG